MSEQPDYSPFPRPWTAETMTQLADYAEAGPVLSAMERDLVEVVRLAALRSVQTPASAPVSPAKVCECGTTMVCPDIGCDRNKPSEQET